MDTNRNTANNYQINTFTKGMNSDTSYDMIGADQYLFGQNIRITNNTLVYGGTQSANRTEGIVTPVPVGKEFVCKDKETGYDIKATDILACASIGDLGVVVVKSFQYWHVYKVEKINNNLQFTDWFRYQIEESQKSFSIVLHKEQEDVVNLYIADGIHPVIQMNMVGKKPNSNIDYLISNRLMPTNRLTIAKTSGRLKTQQLQYTYRFYKKHGTFTKLAPLTNKLQVIDPNRNKEQGNAEDTRTSIGFKLTASFGEAWMDNYDHIQIYRVSYIRQHEQPNVYLIYDDSASKTFEFVDSGDDELQQLSLDEFNALNSQIIIPKSIESNQGYLFAGNIEDKTLLQFTDSEVEKIKRDNKVYRTYTRVTLEGTSVTDLSQFMDSTNVSVNSYFQQRNIVYEESTVTYNNLFASSLLRSLRRGETYQYGVVYYNKYGARSDAFKIENGLNVDDLITTKYVNGTLYAYPIGARFNITIPEGKDIIGYQIVRCQKTSEYCENILQVALSRPLRQYVKRVDSQNKMSPYYPNMLLTTQNTIISYATEGQDYVAPSNQNIQYYAGPAYNVKNKTLFQLFSPEINVRRKDVMSELQTDSVYMVPIMYLYDENHNLYTGDVKEPDWNHWTQWFPNIYNQVTFNDQDADRGFEGTAIWLVKHKQPYDMETKAEYGEVHKYYKKSKTSISATQIAIKGVADVKNPGWDQGFSNVQLGGSNTDLIASAIKQYKSFQTNLDSHQYVNWAANGMYDLAVTENEAGVQQSDQEFKYWVFDNTKLINDTDAGGYGWIGPGPVCLLASVNESESNAITQYVRDEIGTYIVNIKHAPQQYNDTYTPYYGFGNYFSAGITNPVVFDGDVYITPAEFVNLFKTYDFNDKQYSLMSGQMVYYIPLESRINTYFDYGMNYRNTNSNNLMLEPGEITGITSQERPLHQYNMIYSDNNTSVEVFQPWTKNKPNDSFPHRICYSQLKTDGENIDNWQIFRPADFIDVDSRYGEITDLLTSDNTLYYWQNNAFGKLSVNERSLVKDENSNSIQLGTGGVLNRYDYLSTRYGMKADHRAAIAAEHGVYWIDTVNKAIPAYTGNGVINFSEMCNVQNIVNQCMEDSTPSIDYDLQNYELLCKIGPDYQMAFNLKLQCCTSVYTRSYVRSIDMGNTLYHLNIGSVMTAKKANYISTEDEYEFMPVKLSFAVSPQASLTKVYDNQKLVFTQDPIAFDLWEFETDYQSTSVKPEIHSDRENNIWYPMPRTNGNKPNAQFMGRMRGKWLKQDVEIDNPTEFGLSHIITKFRQSYS